jgi:hypothetical protein
MINWNRGFKNLATSISLPYFNTFTYGSTKKEGVSRVKISGVDHLKQRIGDTVETAIPGIR